MGIMNYFNQRIDKRRNKMLQNGICPDCSGKGFLEYGFEYVSVFDCPTCEGSGKPIVN